MLFLIRSGFWLGLVFHALGQAPGVGAAREAIATAAAGAARLCLDHAADCAAPLAGPAAGREGGNLATKAPAKPPMRAQPAAARASPPRSFDRGRALAWRRDWPI